jgi:uncharacterized protein YecE (DUF72 family)
MSIWVGTSGYNYPEWRGSFYPEKMPTKAMLPYYAERFSTVEINYTFYRSPTPKILAGWSEAAPQHFKFTLKAPKRITHIARLKDCAEPLEYFLETARTLGSKLGVILFQLPPSLKQDLARLEAFADLLPADLHAAFEFRHPSWLSAETLALLRSRNFALCIADTEESSTPLEITAEHAYFRLRDEGYTPADLGRWARSIRERTAHCREVFVYFKHEESGSGPAFARIFLEALGKP